MNFRSHILSGIFIGIVFSFILFFLREDFSFSFLIFLPFFAAVLGSVLPDIDHHASIPFRFLTFLVFIFAFIVSFSILSEPGNETISTLSDGAVFNIIKFTGNTAESGAIKISVFFLISLAAGILSVIALKILRPKHRGITHKKITGIFIGSALFILLYMTTQNVNFSALMFFSFTAGFFSHLILDNAFFKV